MAICSTSRRARDEAARAFLVPTLATYSVLADEGQRLKWSDGCSPSLIASGRRHAMRLLSQRRRACRLPLVLICLALCIPHQAREWRLRSAVQTPVEQLQSATSVAATVLNQEGQLGVITPARMPI